MLTKVDENLLEITVHGNSFFAARLRDEKSMDAIRKISSQFFGRKMNIKIEQVQGATFQENQLKENDRTSRLRKEALSHPIVTEALEVFQGKVVDVKIL
jgi:DNA polymerase-3 subunit gamma/tau